jgi:hypothetical protein
MDKGKNQDFKGAELLEVKKSGKANLEQNRTTWLLMGFVFALVTLFAGLELTEQQDKEEQPAPKSKSKDDIIVVVEEIPPLECCILLNYCLLYITRPDSLVRKRS